MIKIMRTEGSIEEIGLLYCDEIDNFFGIDWSYILTPELMLYFPDDEPIQGHDFYIGGGEVLCEFF